MSGDTSKALIASLLAADLSNRLFSKWTIKEQEEVIRRCGLSSSVVFVTAQQQKRTYRDFATAACNATTHCPYSRTTSHCWLRVATKGSFKIDPSVCFLLVVVHDLLSVVIWLNPWCFPRVWSCMSVHMYACLCTYMHVCVCMFAVSIQLVYAYMYIPICVCTHVYVAMRMSSHMVATILLYMRMHVHVCTHVCTHTIAL